MDNSTGQKWSELGSDLAKFTRRYSRSKTLGVLTAFIWVFGLFEVALADIFKTSWHVSVGISVFADGVLTAAALLYLRAGTKNLTPPTSCSTSIAEHGCSQPGCDKAGGGCITKFDTEIAQRIAQMEREKLSLLLRGKVGIGLVLPLFWLVVGAKVALSHGIGTQVGGLALIIGSAGLIATRLYLGAGIFSRKAA